jgi:hypothetical protein
MTVTPRQTNLSTPNLGGDAPIVVAHRKVKDLRQQLSEAETTPGTAEAKVTLRAQIRQAEKEENRLKGELPSPRTANTAQAALCARTLDMARKYADRTGRAQYLHTVEWWQGQLAMLLHNPHNGGHCTVIIADRDEIRQNNFLDRLQEYVERALCEGIDALKPRRDA